MKSWFLLLLVAGTLQCVALECAALERSDSAGKGFEPGSPNIVLIVAEDMSGRVGAFGDMVARTPSIDALAGEGVRYPNVFSAAGVCAPNRSALITGVYPISMGTHQMRTTSRDYLAVPPPAVKAFPELLRRAGYATVNVAKTDYQFGTPFTVWDLDLEEHALEPDLAPWRKLPDSKPFLAMITLMFTHESYLATPETRAGKLQGMIDTMVREREKKVAPVTDPKNVTVPPYYPDTPEVRASIAQHYDNIHYMDSEVGRILANLEADGLADDTIVIWTTDHGDALPRAKRSVYDAGLRVPLIIRYPDGRDKGSINTAMVSAVDIAPTILGLAGVDVPEFVQGRDFIAGGDDRQYIFAARDRMDLTVDRVRAVRDGRYKYIRNYMPELPYFRPLAFRDMFPIMQALWSGHEAGALDPIQNFYFEAPRPREELYDTLVDPFEVVNLAGDRDQRENLRRLGLQLDGWIAAVGDRGEQPEEEMIEEMWPGGKQPETASPRASISAAGEGKVTMALESPTPGASIGYRIAGADGEVWQLYTRPLLLDAGTGVKAKAVRYGYAESAVTSIAGEAP